MRYDPENHRRRTIRLKGYDYSQAGAYYITVCAQNRDCPFGDVVGESMQLNDVGKTIQSVWHELPTRFPNVELDSFVVMPNHIHGIIILVGAGLALPNKGAASSAPTLGDVVRAFKSITAIKVNRLLSRSGQPLWQRNYYEHIVRNEEDLNGIRRYIADNPGQWESDRENPAFGAGF